MSNSARYKVGLVIPTLNAGSRWVTCLEAIRRQSLLPDRLLVIDSESVDNTVKLAEQAGFETQSIKRTDFNHGGTRQLAAEYLLDCDIVIFLTQDAVPANELSFERLIHSFRNSTIAVAYGRQLPHPGATPIESYARSVNYGAVSIVKNAGSAKELGPKAFFCSNSFAAYRRSVLIALGGFHRNVILGEDMEFAARAIKAGYANMYCAEAIAFHSHDYKLGETFRRYFDIGVFDADNSWMREQFGSHSGEGLRFVASELKYLATCKPSVIPRALLQTAAKWVGYRAGRLHQRIPVSVKRKVSMFSTYWDSKADVNHSDVGIS